MTDIAAQILENNKKDHDNVLIIAGPTGSGKSKLALSLCERYDIELVSCDSMQIYRMMDIGTAKATRDEMAMIPHHMIDIIDPWENYNAYLYKDAAQKCIDDILKRGKLPVVCGGTGLYVNTLIDNREFTETINEKEYEFIYDMDIGEAYRRLGEIDPTACEIIHINNEKRVRRALVLCLATGKSMNERNAESHKFESKFNYTTICLMPNREKLYENIDKRVEKMFDMGLVAEANNVYQEVIKHVDAEAALKLTAMSAIGYKELLPPGSVPLDFAKEQIKIDTRHYAKRQITWFKKTPGAIFLEV